MWSYHSLVDLKMEMAKSREEVTTRHLMLTMIVIMSSHNRTKLLGKVLLYARLINKEVTPQAWLRRRSLVQWRTSAHLMSELMSILPPS